MLLCEQMEMQQVDPLQSNGGKSARLITGDNRGPCIDTRTERDMDGTSAQSTPVLDKAEKTIVTNVYRRLQTAVDAKAACNDPATGLLDLSGKCAAMGASLNSTSKRCPVGVRRLKGILSALFAMLSNMKCVVR